MVKNIGKSAGKSIKGNKTMARSTFPKRTVWWNIQFSRRFLFSFYISVFYINHGKLIDGQTETCTQDGHDDVWLTCLQSSKFGWGILHADWKQISDPRESDAVWNNLQGCVRLSWVMLLQISGISDPPKPKAKSLLDLCHKIQDHVSDRMGMSAAIFHTYFVLKLHWGVRLE